VKTGLKKIRKVETNECIYKYHHMFALLNSGNEIIKGKEAFLILVMDRVDGNQFTWKQHP